MGIKKGGECKRGAPLHVVEGSRVFWINSTTTLRVVVLLIQNPYFPTTLIRPSDTKNLGLIKFIMEKTAAECQLVMSDN